MIEELLNTAKVLLGVNITLFQDIFVHITGIEHYKINIKNYCRCISHIKYSAISLFQLN